MESQNTGFPLFSLLLEIPAGFPHSQCFDGGIKPGFASHSPITEPFFPQGDCKVSHRYKTSAHMILGSDGGRNGP